MASQYTYHREGTNPLRPYSVPTASGSSPAAPSAAAGAPGTAPTASPAAAAAAPPAPVHGSVGNATASTAAAAAASAAAAARQNNASRYASRARDMLQDLDYDSYLDAAAGDGSSGAAAAVRGLRAVADGLLWKYTSVLMAQPFEVAKAVLQVRSAQEDFDAVLAAAAAPTRAEGDGRVAKTRGKDRADEGVAETDPDKDGGDGQVLYDVGNSSAVWKAHDESDSENEEQSFFSHPAAPAPFLGTTPPPSAARRPRPRGRQASSSSSSSSSSDLARNHHRNRPQPSPHGPVAGPSSALAKSHPHHLQLRRADSVLEVINQLWQKEGPFGVWKGSNATFLYSVLQSLLENWSRSLMSAVFNVPDLGVVADMDRVVEIAAPYPWASLFVAATAAVATGLVLAPLDLVRTRLLLTPISQTPRRTLSLLRGLPSYLCPAALVVPTALHALVHPVLTLSTPLVVRTQFMIDSQLSPMAFSVAKFFASSACLFVKLPLETVLRRGQVAVLLRQQPRREAEGRPLDTVVPVGRYGGVLGTMYHIVAEEGSREVVPAKAPPKLPAAKAGAAGKGRRVGGRAAEAVYLKGQGLEGLWRGWRVGWWGLVGLWISSVVGNGGEGEF